MRQNKKQVLRRIIILLVSSIFLFILLLPVINGKVSLEKYITEYSSFILIFLTYIYVLLTYEILHSNNLLTKEQLRPYVIANIIDQNNQIYFSIKNYGKRPAFNIQTQISDGIDEYQIEELKGNYKEILNQKFLAPSQEISIYLTEPAYVLSKKRKNLNKCFKIRLKYYDSENQKYELDDYQVDLNDQYNEKITKKNSVIISLNSINEEIKKLNKIIESKR